MVKELLALVWVSALAAVMQAVRVSPVQSVFFDTPCVSSVRTSPDDHVTVPAWAVPLVDAKVTLNIGCVPAAATPVPPTKVTTSVVPDIANVLVPVVAPALKTTETGVVLPQVTAPLPSAIIPRSRR